MPNTITSEKVPNRLINEKSPYLLQHAYNPVNWYPWGTEAFSRAKAMDKPIFLSIGYSSCHWCHVMNKESFNDQKISEVLNNNFIPIKVDREERADIDHFYMEACQAMTGSGGWPLSAFLSPDGKPFFCGTYFPPEDIYSTPGFYTLLSNVINLWANEREKLVESSKEIVEYIKNNNNAILDKGKSYYPQMTYRDLFIRFDPENGGFDTSPKFPSAHNILFLLNFYEYLKNNAENKYEKNNTDIAMYMDNSLKMVEKTLDKMMAGGIMDHLWGGFYRYSTDEKWLVPHFEKMLYDNAMLLETYTVAGSMIKPVYHKIAKFCADYTLKYMKGSEGGFYTSLDADSEGEEGKFYLWKYDEVISILGKEEGKKFCEIYDITPKGNFDGVNILNLIKRGFDVPTYEDTEDSKERLRNTALKRGKPMLDDKILLSSNGLMISAMAKAGHYLKEDAYLEAATEACSFILEKLYINNRFLASYRDGKASHKADCEGYAYFIRGLLDVYAVTFDPYWLLKAYDINNEALELFYDRKDKSFYLSGSDVRDLPAYTKNYFDNALPSGNSVALSNIQRLGAMLYDENLMQISEDIRNSNIGRLASYPSYMSFFASAFLADAKNTTTVTIVDGEDRDKLLNKFDILSPFVNIVLLSSNYNDEFERLAEKTGKKERIGNKATAYICKNMVCGSPVTADMLK